MNDESSRPLWKSADKISCRVIFEGVAYWHQRLLSLSIGSIRETIQCLYCVQAMQNCANNITPMLSSLWAGEITAIPTATAMLHSHECWRWIYTSNRNPRLDRCWSFIYENLIWRRKLIRDDLLWPWTWPSTLNSSPANAGPLFYKTQPNITSCTITSLLHCALVAHALECDYRI